ncbi:MAG: hypothetical protein JNL74_18840, partial [Fibrobacteres bacterium]|nr:hypothetical protein [Fibrobacterota bacterium]
MIHSNNIENMSHISVSAKAAKKLIDFHKVFPFGLFTKHYICFLVSPEGKLILDNRNAPEMSYHNTRFQINGQQVTDYFNVPVNSGPSDWFKEPCMRYGSIKMAAFNEKSEASILFSDEVRYSQAKRTLYLIELEDADNFSFGVITFLVNPAEGLFANLHPYVLTDNNGVIISFNHAFRAALRLPNNLIQGQRVTSFINFDGEPERIRSGNINWTTSKINLQADFIWPEEFKNNERSIEWRREQHRGPNTFAEYMHPFSYSDANLFEYELDLLEGCPPGLCILAKKGDHTFPDESGYIINFQEKESVVWIKKMGLPINAVKCDFNTLKGHIKISIFYSQGKLALSLNGKT